MFISIQTRIGRWRRRRGSMHTLQADVFGLLQYLCKHFQSRYCHNFFLTFETKDEVIWGSKMVWYGLRGWRWLVWWRRRRGSMHTLQANVFGLLQYLCKRFQSRYCHYFFLNFETKAEVIWGSKMVLYGLRGWRCRLMCLAFYNTYKNIFNINGTLYYCHYFFCTFETKA